MRKNNAVKAAGACMLIAAMGLMTACGSKPSSDIGNTTEASSEISTTEAEETTKQEGITRGQFAQISSEALGLKEKSILYYDDAADLSHYEAVAKAVRAGYMQEQSDNMFRENDIFTKAEFAEALARILPDTDHDYLADLEDPMSEEQVAEVWRQIEAGASIYGADLNIGEEGLILEDTVVAGNVYAAENAGAVSLKNCSVLGNFYVDGAAKVDFSGKVRVLEARESADIVIGEGSQVEYLYVWGDDNAVSLEKEGRVDTLVAYGKTSISGEGTIGLLRANSNGVRCDAKTDRITVGDAVTEMPVIAGEEVFPYDPAKVPAESPDKAAIMESAARIPAIEEIPYEEGVDYHTEVYDKSHAFSSMYCSVGSVNLEENQYIEKEFLMTGKANVYNLYENDVPYIAKPDNEYGTRLLVRYPDTSKGKKSSGRVYLDILNASSGIDLEDLWRRSYQHIMDQGDIYIGITSQSGTAEALKRFDEERYAGINWEVDGIGEDGLAFDMFSQLGTLLRTEPQAILPADMKPEYIYLTGQSWSGDYINTYTSVFYDYYHTDENPIFDGYLGIVNPAETFIATDVAGPVRSFKAMSEPYLIIMSEGEHYFGSYGDWYNDFEYVRIPDADEKDHKVRFYEVAGAGHSDPVSPIIPNNPEIAKANEGTDRPPKVYQGEEKPSDLQLDMVITAALENLHKWAAEGVPAPSGDQYWISYRTVVDPFVNDMPEVITDENGNALGGIRMPQMEAPIAQYKPFRNDASTTDGSMIYFTKDKLKELYPGGYEEYQAKFQDAAERLLKERYILQEDYEKLIQNDSNKELFAE